MNRIDALLRRLAAVALLLLVLAPLPIAGLWALAAYRGGEAERQEKLERYDRLRAIAAYGAAARQAPAPPDVSRYLLGSGPSGVLTAGLQARLREIAASQGVEVLQASELKAREAEGLTALGISAEMVGPAQGVHAVLQQIDLAVPWLFLGKLQMRSGYAEGVTHESEPPLAVGLEIWGLAAP
jgi:hypothetical protein